MSISQYGKWGQLENTEKVHTCNTNYHKAGGHSQWKLTPPLQWMCCECPQNQARPCLLPEFCNGQAKWHIKAQFSVVLKSSFLCHMRNDMSLPEKHCLSNCLPHFREKWVLQTWSSNSLKQFGILATVFAATTLIYWFCWTCNGFSMSTQWKWLPWLKFWSSDFNMGDWPNAVHELPICFVACVTKTVVTLITFKWAWMSTVSKCRKSQVHFLILWAFYNSANHQMMLMLQCHIMH